MKIKDVIRTLIESGEDFSDHGARRVGIGEQGQLDPMHTGNPFDDSVLPCDFCAAWRAAQAFLALNIQDTFEPGDKVSICGKTPGVVEAVRVQYDVRLGEVGDAYRRVGTFAPEFVKAVPDAIFYRDREGDLWKVTGAKTLSLCDPNTWEPLTGKFEHIAAEKAVIREWGPLKRVEKGA